ncbi:MAG: hypothetical protein J6U39_00525 [Clostridia bacterium]|nr:hypothetical protein [Clostridia bacterium]
MNCLLVINTMSGNSCRVNEKALIAKYAADDDVTVKYLRDPSDEYSVEGIDKLIVCGGDGTLNRALSLSAEKDIDLYYLPCGTFNETAKSFSGKGLRELGSIGKIGDREFAYVAAAGSFTDLGQAANPSAKKRFKLFAYFAKVLSSYRVHRIKAKITTESLSLSGTYTLIMLSNAKRCFGFRFNRLHKRCPDLQLIAISAPKKDNLWGRIKMFFPFFRVFFLGIGRERRKGNILVTSFKEGSISLSEETPFCLDGESVLLSGENPMRKSAARVFLIKE